MAGTSGVEPSSDAATRDQVLKTKKIKAFGLFSQKVWGITKTGLLLFTPHVFISDCPDLLFRKMRLKSKEPRLHLNTRSGCGKEHTWPETFGSIPRSPGLKPSIVMHKQNPDINVNRINAAPGNESVIIGDQSYIWHPWDRFAAVYE